LLSGMVEHVLRGHTWSVCSVACSLDGGKIITGSSDCSARIWNTSGKHLHLLERHTGPVHSVAFLPDSKRVVTGSKDGTVCLWDSDTGCPVYRFTGAGEVRSIATFPDGKRFASCAGNQVTIWSLKNGTSPGAERREHSTSAPVVEAGSMVFSSNGQKVLLLPSLRILDAVTLKE
jgi:WD40 repeat protein